ARDLQHLLEQGMEALRLPLQDLDVARVARLPLLQAAGERIRESLDAGERRLQLVRREREEAVLARVALGGFEDGGGAFSPFDEAAPDAALGQVLRARFPVAAEHLQSGAGVEEDGRARGLGEP